MVLSNLKARHQIHDRVAFMLHVGFVSFSAAGTGSLLEEPVEHQPLVLEIYMCAVDAAVYGQHFDILGCDALAGA